MAADVTETPPVPTPPGVLRIQYRPAVPKDLRAASGVLRSGLNAQGFIGVPAGRDVVPAADLLSLLVQRK
jgi:hypothetical protein